jgi:uncharacterized membrane protein
MRPKSQRDVMRQLFREHRSDSDRVVRAYAAAERRGEVTRLRNSHDLDAETYARALLADGERKGWLEGNTRPGRHRTDR